MKKTVPRLLFRLLPLVALALLAACATGPRITSDADPSADFSRYGSYAFYEPLAMEQSGYTTYLTNTVKTAIRAEMDARGYRYDESSPDLRVNFQGFIRERTDVYTVPRSDVNYYYDYWARTYVAIPVWYDQTRVRDYTEGTLSIDIVDARRNHLLWTGAAVGRVTQQTATERAAEADAAVRQIFTRFPGVARR